MRALATEGMLPSRLQRALYRLRGYQIADDVSLAPGVVIEAEEVSIGHGCSIGLGTVLRGRRIELGRRVSIGSFCFFDARDIEIGDDTVVREQVFVGGPLLPDSLLRLGKRVRVFQMCFLNPSRPLVVGDDSGVGGRSSVFTHASWQSALEGFPVTFAPTTIGANVWLPWHVFILPGVEIGDNATISAGSVVMRSLPAGCLAGGVPARVMQSAENWPRQVDPEEQWSIATGIIEEFTAYLQGNGISCTLLAVSDGERMLELIWNGKSRRVVLLREAALARQEDDIAVVLTMGTIETQARAWFDLLGRRKGGSVDPVVEETELFLNRYGIRFAPAEEAPPEGISWVSTSD